MNDDEIGQQESIPNPNMRNILSSIMLHGYHFRGICSASRKTKALLGVPEIPLCNAQISVRFITRTLSPQEEDLSPVVSSEAQSVYEEVMTRYNSLLTKSIEGGGARGIERHVLKNKKILVRDRIKMLVDPGTSFLELGNLVGFDMSYGDVPAGGIVAGIGRVAGIYCMIAGNDATVKGGTYYPITVTKSLRSQQIAELNKLPCIYMPDSGGAFLPLQSEIFLPGGRSFYNQAMMSSQGIPQIAVVCGSCTAGGAYNPTMSDEAIVIDRIGKIFLGGPPLVRAALGEIVTEEDLGGAFMHSSVSGCTDYYAKDEQEAFEMCRDIVEALNFNGVQPKQSFNQPLHEISWKTDARTTNSSPMLPQENELAQIIKSSHICQNNQLSHFGAKEHLSKSDLYTLLSALLDGSQFKEFKVFYGPGLIAGIGSMEGMLVGVVANADEILSAEALKAAHFLDMCNRREIPLLFLQNSLPIASKSTDSMDQVVLKDRGKLSSMVATLNVPKIAVTLSACYEDDFLLMCGPSFNPNLHFMWPNSKISLLDMASTGPDEGEMLDSLDAFSAAFNQVTDAIIIPQDTRQMVSESLRILSQQKLNIQQDVSMPIFRM